MLRFSAPLLTAMALLASPASALDLSSLSGAERDAFRAEVRAYLLDNPDVILEALDVLETRRAAEQEQSDQMLVAHNAKALFEDENSYVGGNAHGDITLVEFVDYRCGYCRKAAPEVAALLESDGNIRLILKELPILGEDSLTLSRFAIAAQIEAGDEAYKQVHDTLIAYTGGVDEIALLRIATDLGLDGESIIARMDSDEVTDRIRASHALAQNLQIRGTPSFVLHDELLRGYLPADKMAEIVAEKRG